MAKVSIGPTVFAKPINGAYNTLHDRAHVHARMFMQFSRTTDAFLNLGGHRACHNAKMSIGPATDRALEVSTVNL